MLEKMFRLEENGTTVRTEIIGGATTFVTMAYILILNPAILSFAGIPVGPSTVATAMAAIFGTMLMGLYANRPIAVAPYMGENAFIAFGLAAMGITWQQRLGSVFISGILFFVITIIGLRTWLANSISNSMKHSFAVGIGLFLTLIGMYETGIVTSFVTGMPAAALLQPNTEFLRNPDVPVKIGNLHDPQVLLGIAGFLIMVILMYHRIKGAILIGIAVTAVVGGLLGYGSAPKAIFAIPFQGEYSLAPVAFQLDIKGVLEIAFLPVLLTLFLMSFLDTLGTLMGLGATAGMLDKDGNFPKIERPMIVDAASCVFSGLIGTSTSGAYIESATGIREGARTGLTSMVTAFFFGVSLFFIPLIEPLQMLRFAYAPALMAVGTLMVASFAKIEYEDATELIPAFATIAMMVFTYNIANGLTAGLILYPLMKVFTGRYKEVNAGAIVLAVLCLTYYVFGLVH